MDVATVTSPTGLSIFAAFGMKWQGGVLICQLMQPNMFDMQHPQTARMQHTHTDLLCVCVSIVLD